VADDIRELNALVENYGREFQSPDRRRGPSLASARLYNEDYQPATGSQQAEMLMSLLPGVGEGLDAAHFAKDIGDRNYLGAGLSGLSLVVPGLGAATIKKIAGATQKGSPVVSKFTTGRGSTYEQYNDGTTQRNRSGARHRDTSTGLQPRSNKTVFADKDSINSVGGIFQNTDMATRLDPVFDNDGNITEMSLNLLEDFGPRRAGESLASVPVTTRPEVGLYPVEIGNPESPMGSSGSGVHFGSEIISVDSAKPVNYSRGGSKFREGPPINIGDTTHPSLLTSDGETPEALYRVVSRKEFDKAQESGKFTPSSFYERTHASSSPDMRYKNAPDDVVIKIKYDPDDGWYSKQSLDEVYGVTRQDIPISRISEFPVQKKSRGGSVVERPNNYEPKAI